MGTVRLALGTALLLYLATTNELYHVLWLACNLLDTFRAARSMRANGRRIGAQTRRRAMKEALRCWIAYLALRWASGIPERLLGWLPFYAPVKLVIFAGFMLARTSTSASFLTSFLRPWLRPYESHIDLTVSLFSSATALLFYCAVMPPLLALTQAITSLRTIIQKGKTSLTGSFAVSAVQTNGRQRRDDGNARDPPKLVIDFTGEEEPSRKSLAPTTQTEGAHARTGLSATTTRATKKTSRPAVLPPSIVVDDSPTARRGTTPSRTGGASAALLTPPQSPKPAREAPTTLLVPTMAPVLRRSPRRHAGNRASPFSVDDGDDLEQTSPSRLVRFDAPTATKKTTRNLMAALDALPRPPSELPSPDVDVFLAPSYAEDQQIQPSTQPGAIRKLDLQARNAPKAQFSKATASAPAAKRKAAGGIAPAAKKQVVAPPRRMETVTGNRSDAAAVPPAALQRQTAGMSARGLTGPSTRPAAARRSAQGTGTKVRSGDAGSNGDQAQNGPQSRGSASDKQSSKVPVKAPTRSGVSSPPPTSKPAEATASRPGQAVVTSRRSARTAIDEHGSASVTVAGTKRKISAMGAPSKRVKRDD